MNLKFWKTEKRAASYTDTLTALLLSQASGQTLAAPAATAGASAASGVVARAFAVADIEGPANYTAGLTPVVMALIGRALIHSGEIVLAIDIEDGMVKVWPASDFDIVGGYQPDSWRYRVNLGGPSRYYTRDNLGADAVVHIRYLTDPARPWRGVGPIQSAALAGKLSAETTKALADELSGPRGSLMPFPGKDGDDPSLDKLKTDLKTLGGSMAFVESMAGGYGTPDARQGGEDNKPRRIGAEPPTSTVTLQTTAFNELVAACGLSPLLFDAKAPGGSFREAWRQALHGVIAPLGKIVQAELQDKIHPDIVLNFDGLMASDISGRARAFQSMTNGGMDVTKAAALSGLMMQDED